ncbi:hypothetical protein THAOC_35497 [Thalassiosira oceanica]|uniref:Uncharacterized protein n=1 Tax=Thalassiosira oceanica TaxID=159749 RepID=K0RGZ5_THAOC|nr:hypothetical protein THAOC_35497 [Thalassiosira oceanica]|eukprot:EJK45867.1 hypothetical protein THAOC_35497 [Thalassiosira oceanica]
MFMDGLATKDDYASALRGHQSAIEEMSSPDSDQAKAFGNGPSAGRSVQRRLRDQEQERVAEYTRELDGRCGERRREGRWRPERGECPGKSRGGACGGGPDRPPGQKRRPGHESRAAFLQNLVVRTNAVRGLLAGEGSLRPLICSDANDW